MAARALATVLLLLSVVIVSIIGLIPGQSRTALGVELLLVGVVFAALVTRQTFASLPHAAQHLDWLAGRILIAAIGTIPIVIGGLTLLAESGGGLYWVAGGIIGATVGGVATAWVLLVEILR